MSDCRCFSFAPKAAKRPKAVSIGFFDGVHRGHRFLLDRLSEEAAARDLAPWALTFDAHPAAVVGRREPPKLLTSLSEKVDLLSQCGLAGCGLLHFTPKMAALTAEAFMREVLAGELGARLLVVGYDHRFGRPMPEDGFERYREIGDAIGIEVIRTPHFEADMGISSSAIRALLSQGEVGKAAHRLGRCYAVGGTVVHGFQNGRKIGFPTANIVLAEPEKLIPAAGSYATWAVIDGLRLPAMTNIGRRPTFDNGPQITIETHVQEFDGDLYGQCMEVQFVQRLRDEQKFENIEALRAQLADDALRARNILTHTP